MSNDKRQEAVSKLFFEKETFNLKFDHFIQQQKEPYQLCFNAFALAGRNLHGTFYLGRCPGLRAFAPFGAYNLTFDFTFALSDINYKKFISDSA